VAAKTRREAKNKAYFKRAQKVLVGGVNSPVRAFKGVGGTPVSIAKAKGPYFWDLDGNRYIDYVLSWGPLILGHAHPAVLKAIRDTAAKGTSFGACHPLEAELAERVRDLYPSCEKLRFVSSGTEATLSALRLARGATGRSFILKFEGCYHGHGDSLLVKAGSGAQTLGTPDSKGVTAQVAQHTLTAPYNDLMAAQRLFETYGPQIAAVIVEPVAGNMGFVRPLPGFLQGLRLLCDRHQSLLIFDEVMTGFRVALRGAQGLFKIKPDLTCLGKVIGGGLPAAAFGGRREIMDQLAPLGPVYQAGTLSGNPLAMAAGLTMLTLLSKPGVYKGLQQGLDQLLGGWQRLFDQAGIPVQIDGEGSMFGLYFSRQPVHDLAGAKASDSAFFAKLYHALLAEGVYLAPSAFEAGFLSTAHGPAIIKATHQATARALTRLGARA
jgi:glutamate-1-semialdehyde 2,1-aminomutase